MINVSICGHDSHHPSSLYREHPKGLPDYLLLLVKTDAWFILDGEKISTGPNMAILFDKGSYICYGRSFAGYNDDWIHFSFSEESDPIGNTLHIPFAEPLYLPQFHTLSHYVLQLTSIFHNSLSHKELLLDSMMRVLLYSLDEQISFYTNPYIRNKHYTAFQELRTKLYNNPGDRWTIADMASSLYLSSSYFQHLYRNFFQCSCQQDIIRARLELAKFHLSSSNLSIRSLAEYCGYENELHFMRQFKKFEGMTPSEFRKAYF